VIAPPSPPSHDELEALIKEARARQLRRRLLGAAGVAVAAAMGLSVYAALGGGGPRNAGRTAGDPGLAAAPLCRGSQLSTSIGFGAATGSLLGGAEIRNTGPATCSLPQGRPDTEIRLHGRTLSVRETAPPNPFPGALARTIRPGHEAIVWMQWFNWCGKRGAPTAFRFRFRGGLTLVAAVDGMPRCDSSSAPSSLYVSVPRRPQ